MPPNERTCVKVFRYEQENPHAEAAEVAETTGLARKTVYNCHYVHESEELLGKSDPTDAFTQLLDEEDQELWQSFKDYGRNVKIKRDWQDQARAQIKPENGKAYLVGLGDTHIENIMAYIDKLESDILTLKEKDNVGIVVPGDLSDNAVKYMDLTFETITTPKEARRLAKMALALVKDKIIAMSSGCHEKHSENQVDYNPIQKLCEDWNKPYLGYQGLLELRVGAQRYKVAMSHKGMGNSMYNDCHGAVRILREVYGDADIVITAHTHQAAFLSQVENGKKRLMVNIGSYKQGDRYSRQGGFPHSQDNLDTPVIELSADRRHWEVYQDVSVLHRQ